MDPLRRCTGDPETFLTATWGVRADVHPAADPRGFQDLLTLDDVDRILTTTSPRTPSFRLVKAGEQIPESAYTRSGRTGSKPVSGMADPARITELFDDGATIVLQGLHRNWEPVAAFCRALTSSTLRWPPREACPSCSRMPAASRSAPRPKQVSSA